MKIAVVTGDHSPHPEGLWNTPLLNPNFCRRSVWETQLTLNVISDEKAWWLSHSVWTLPSWSISLWSWYTEAHKQVHLTADKTEKTRREFQIHTLPSKKQEQPTKTSQMNKGFYNTEKSPVFQLAELLHLHRKNPPPPFFFAYCCILFCFQKDMCRPPLCCSFSLTASAQWHHRR